jgi:hypothetical protein
VNWSTLVEMRRSPLHYRHRLTTPRPDSPAMALGRLIHTAVLEPERLDDLYVPYDGRRGTNAYKDFVAGEAREVISVDDYEKALEVSARVWGHSVARRVLARGRVETPITWVDERTHVRCKARPDHVRGAALTDLKSSRNIEEREFARTTANLAYHGQLAFYRRGLEARSGRPVGAVRIVAVEAEAPHDVAVYRLNEETLDAGDILVDHLLDELVASRKRGSWPGGYRDETELGIPAWALPIELFTDEIEVLS